MKQNWMTQMKDNKTEQQIHCVSSKICNQCKIRSACASFSSIGEGFAGHQWRHLPCQKHAHGCTSQAPKWGEDGMHDCLLSPPPFFNSLIKEHWHVSAGNGAITVFGRRFLTNEHTSVNTPVNTIKSIVEGNLSKGDSDSALNSVHETWD